MGAGREDDLVDLGIEGLSAGTFLGAGGSANVFAASRLETGEHVAVKLLRASATSEKERARFTREHETLAQLDEHVGIVPVVDAGITSKFEPYFLMPLLPGSLQDRLDAEGPLDWALASQLMVDVADTIEFAHSKKVLHRDLKPGNILLDDDGVPRVSDFGIAKLMDTSVSKSSKALGTPSFMPPERFTTAETTEVTDVYGLGATLAALITGTSPFLTGQNDTDAAVMMRVLNDAPPDLATSGVPEEIAGVITSAMAKDPKSRPGSAAEFAQMLRTALAELGHVAAAPPTVAVPRRSIEVPSAPVEIARELTEDVRPVEDANHKRRAPMTLLGAVGAVALVAFGLTSVVGDGDTVLEASGEVFLERADSAGDDPFIDEFDSLVEFDPTDITRVSAQTSSGGGESGATGELSNEEILSLAFKGGEPGLYGGTGNSASCNKAAFIAFLEETEAKGAAWASVQGIDPSNLRSYIESLTPVILLADTRVTNHGFKNSVANPLQSVLQAGTAVLVDDAGVPRAKCGCGNPLLPPVAQSGKASLVGVAWDGFNPAALAVVTADDEPVESFLLQDVETGTTIERPAGTDGQRDELSSLAAPTPLDDLKGLESRRDAVDTEVASATEVPEVEEADDSASTTGAPARTASVSNEATETTEAPSNSGTAQTSTTIQQPTTTERATTTTSGATTTSRATTTTRAATTTTSAATTTTRATTTTTTSAPTTTTTTTTTSTTTTTAAPTPRNITSRGSVSANSVFQGFSVGAAVDGSTATSWFSIGPEVGPALFTWRSNAPSLISQIQFVGNGNHSNADFRQGFGFKSVRVEVVNAGAVVWSGSGSGNGGSFAPGVEGNEVRLVFSGHESNDCGGFSELIITALE